MDWIDANTFFGSWPKRRLDVSAPGLVSILRAVGTARALTLSLVAPLLDSSEGTRLTLEAAGAHPELLPLGCVDPRTYYGGDAVAELAGRGCAALRIPNGLTGTPLDFAPLELLLRQCAVAGLTAFLDVPAVGAVTQAERLVDLTGCRIVVCGASYWALSELIVCLRGCRSLYCEVSKMDTPDGIRILCGEVGAKRVLFGSGAPFAYASCARRVAEHSGLSNEELEWLSHKTLFSLLPSGVA